jgi:hypothetical protein
MFVDSLDFAFITHSLYGDMNIDLRIVWVSAADGCVHHSTSGGRQIMTTSAGG